MHAIPSVIPLSRTQALTSSVMSVTVRPPAVRRLRSCWKTFTGGNCTPVLRRTEWSGFSPLQNPEIEPEDHLAVAAAPNGDLLRRKVSRPAGACRAADTVGPRRQADPVLALVVRPRARHDSAPPPEGEPGVFGRPRARNAHVAYEVSRVEQHLAVKPACSRSPACGADGEERPDYQ